MGWKFQNKKGNGRVKKKKGGVGGNKAWRKSPGRLFNEEGIYQAPMGQ